jgi:hypothetical protein
MPFLQGRTFGLHLAVGQEERAEGDHLQFYFSPLSPMSRLADLAADVECPECGNKSPITIGPYSFGVGRWKEIIYGLVAVRPLRLLLIARTVRVECVFYLSRIHFSSRVISCQADSKN